VGKRRIKVLEVLALPGRALTLLELDHPVPVPGLTEGMTIELELEDGRQREAVIKSLGFASSTPDHAHIVISQGPEGPLPVASVQFEFVPPTY
jgi:hypothetical protein